MTHQQPEKYLWGATTLLRENLKEGGIMIIDDGYIDDASKVVHPAILSKGEVLEQIQKAVMILADEAVATSGDAAAI